MSVSRSLAWFAFLLVILSSCKTDIEKAKRITRQENGPMESADDVVMIYTDSGETKARITAPLMQHFSNNEKPYTNLPKGLNGTFYENEQAQSFVSSEEGVFYDKEKKLVLKRNVVLVNVKGDTLQTEYLEWEESIHKLHTDKFVKITTPEETLFGYGMEADEDFKNYKIFKLSGRKKLQENILQPDSVK